LKVRSSPYTRPQSSAVALCRAGSEYEANCSERRACVANVGQSVRSAVGEDVFIRDLQDGDTRVHFVKAAADHGFPDIQNAPAETVMIPEPALQGPVDEEPKQLRIGDFGLRIE